MAGLHGDSLQDRLPLGALLIVIPVWVARSIATTLQQQPPRCTGGSGTIWGFEKALCYLLIAGE